MSGTLTFLDPRDEVEFVKAYYGTRRKIAAFIRALTGASWLLAAITTALHLTRLRATDGDSTGPERQHTLLGGIYLVTGIYQIFLAMFLATSRCPHLVHCARFATRCSAEKYLLEGILHSEERCLKDERLVAYSAMFETWSLMALMLVGRGSSYVVTNYAPLLACVHAIYAAACNMRLHTLLYLHGLGFLCFFYVEAERAMGALLRPGRRTPGVRMPLSVRDLVWTTAVETGVYLLCGFASSCMLATSEVRARTAFLADKDRDERDLGPFWLFARGLVKPFIKTPPRRPSKPLRQPPRNDGEPSASATDARAKEHPE